jgi:hypothetical protein
MLTCHPRICIPPEGGWLIQLYPKYIHGAFDRELIVAFLDDLLSTPKIEGWNLNRAELLRDLRDKLPKSYADAASRVYRHYAEQFGKDRWGDKNNFYLNHLETIARLFPDAVFVHIVRDGRDVACSYRALQDDRSKYAPRLPTDILEIAYRWQRDVDRVDGFLDKWHPERRTVVRYEDLVTAPASVLEELCAVLGEEYSPAMLEFYLQNAELSLEPKEFIGWKRKTLEEVSPSQVRRWQAELVEEEIRAFESLAADALSRHGYRLYATARRDMQLTARINLLRMRKGLSRLMQAKGAGRFWRSILRQASR